MNVKVKLLSRVWHFPTPWTVAYQAPPSMGFSRQEDWNGLPFPSPGDLPDPGIKPGSPTFQADALTSEPPGKPIINFLSLYIYLLQTFHINVILWYAVLVSFSILFSRAIHVVVCAHISFQQNFCWKSADSLVWIPLCIVIFLLLLLRFSL